MKGRKVAGTVNNDNHDGTFNVSFDEASLNYSNHNVGLLDDLYWIHMLVYYRWLVSSARENHFFLTFSSAICGTDPPCDLSDSWITVAGTQPQLAEGNMNEGTSVSDDAKETSFAWRGGQDRQTTGIWMWSEPFIRTTSNGEKIALLLMDTQGMFDHQTWITLTSQIFGLSTFISFYQVRQVSVFVYYCKSRKLNISLICWIRLYIILQEIRRRGNRILLSNLFVMLVASVTSICIIAGNISLRVLL